MIEHMGSMVLNFKVFGPNTMQASLSLHHFTPCNAFGTSDSRPAWATEAMKAISATVSMSLSAARIAISPLETPDLYGFPGSTTCDAIDLFPAKFDFQDHYAVPALANSVDNRTVKSLRDCSFVIQLQRLFA
jgi:hypothetical protein